MAEDLQTTISVLAETGQATSNLGRLDQAFKKFFADAGKTSAEAKAFLDLAKGAESGAVAVDKLDAETRGLLKTYQDLRNIARARDTLNLVPHQKIKEAIDRVRAAYEALKNSGKLTHAELDQAARNTERRIAELSASTGNVSKGFGERFREMRGTLIAVTAALGGVVYAFSRATKAASEQELAEAKLANVVKRVNGETDAQVEALTAQATALQKTTAFADEQVINAQSMLSTFRLNSAAVAQLTPRMLDMATAMEKASGDTLDLKGVSIALGKALTDGLGALKRYGVSMTAADESAFSFATTAEKVNILTRILDGNFKGLAETAGTTFSGKMRIAGNDLSDVLEGFGNAVIKNKDVAAALNGTISTLRSFSAALKENGETMKSFVSGLISIGKAVGAGIVGGLGAAALGALAKLGSSLTAGAAAAGGFAASLRNIPRTIKVAIVFAVAEAGYEFGKFLGEQLDKILPAGKRAEAALARVNEQAAANAKAAGDLAEANKKYSDITVLATAKVAKLSDTERARYVESIEGAIEYQDALRIVAESQAVLGKDTKIEQERSRAELVKLRSALADVEYAAQLTDEQVKNLVSIDAQGLLKTFEKVFQTITKEGKGEIEATREALKALAAGFDPSQTSSIQAFGQALAVLANDGKITAREMGQAWEKALSGLDVGQLTKFKLQAEESLGGATKFAESLAVATDTVLRVSLNRMGVDADKALTGLSKSAREAVDGFDLLAESGKLTADAIDETFNKALSSLDTQKAIDNLRASIMTLGAEGKIAGEKLDKMLSDLDERSADLTPGIQTVTEAYKTLGIEAPKALAAAADKAREAFEVIRDAGGSSEEIRRAFLAYAKAALAAAEATGKPADAMLRAQAAALGLTADLGKLTGENQKLGASFEVVARAQDAAIKTTEAHVKAVEAEGRAAIATAQAELEQAKARNNAVEITKATIALAETESAVAAKVAEAKLAAAAAAADKVVAIEAEALADGKLTEAERELLAVTEEVAAAKQAEADAAQASADAKAIEAETAGKVAEAEQGVAVSIEAALAFQRQRLALTQEYGDAAGAVYDKVAAAIADAAKGENALIELTGGLIERLRRDTAEASADILRLTDNLTRSAAPTDELTRAAARALEQYKDLGAEALAGLRQALDDAKARTEALRDAAKSTVDQLRDQFDQLKGNDEALARREYERKKAELDAQLKAAIKAGDSQAQKDLQEALRLLEQIRVEREKQRAAEAKADAARAKSGGGAGTGAGAPPPPAGRTASGGASEFTFNLYGAEFKEDYFRRKVAPLLDKINREKR